MGMILLGLIVFAEAAAAEFPLSPKSIQAPSSRVRRQKRLSYVFEQIQKDAAQVAEFASALRTELGKDSLDGLPPGIRGRVEKLNCKGRELQDAIKKSDKHRLSIEVMSLAAQIEDEGKALREIFDDLTPRRRRLRLRRLADEIRKKADSVKDKTRMP